MRVTDEMVEVALAAYVRARGTYEREVPADGDDIRAALEAALSHAAGQDGEQCRAASVPEDIETLLDEVVIAARDDERCNDHGYLQSARRRAHDSLQDAKAQLLRALSRGVPEGRQVLPEGWRVSIERGIPGVMWLELNGPKCSTSAQARKQDDVQWRIYERFEAAIAAQRKEG